jgi:hypothetical protein
LWGIVPLSGWGGKPFKYVLDRSNRGGERKGA